jgi:hypothetical protein
MHQTDWDRGFEAGKAQGAIDAYPRTQELERQILALRHSVKRALAKARNKGWREAERHHDVAPVMRVPRVSEGG